MGTGSLARFAGNVAVLWIAPVVFVVFCAGGCDCAQSAAESASKMTGVANRLFKGVTSMCSFTV
jgi:hypothetical protein